MAPSPAIEVSLHGGQSGFGHGTRAQSDGGDAVTHAELRELLLATHHVHIPTLALIFGLVLVGFIAFFRQRRVSPSLTWILPSGRRWQYWPSRSSRQSSSKGGAAGPDGLSTSASGILGVQALEMARQDKDKEKDKEKEKKERQRSGSESRNPLRAKARTPTPHTGPSATVYLAQGRYTGVVLPPSFAVPRAVEAWRGIPFAQTTGGQNRFRPPVPLGLTASSAATPFDASAFGPICPGTASRIPGMLEGEDCLNLNVYRPASPSYEPGGPKMPVVIYVHGGAFNGGLGTERDMSSFVGWSGTPIVGVNFNYRVGALGFPSSTVAEREGALNLGLRDQRLLFEWVRQNIGQFGGDESRVTLMGMSAGAHSVSLVLSGTNLNLGILVPPKCLLHTHHIANTGSCSDRLPSSVIRIPRCPLPPRNNGVGSCHRTCDPVILSPADRAAVQRVSPGRGHRAHPHPCGPRLSPAALATAGDDPLRVKHRLLAVPRPHQMALPARRRVLPVGQRQGQRQR